MKGKIIVIEGTDCSGKETQSKKLEEYLKQSGKMGEDGAIAWGGDAAERAMPVINSIKNDIVQLQNACQEFSENIHLTQSNFTKADATAENSISDLNNI